MPARDRPGAIAHVKAGHRKIEGQFAQSEFSGDGKNDEKHPLVKAGTMPDTLSPDLARKMHAYWRASNYLSVGQIYLKENPLLEAPLKREHIKPRLLGHWGTTPGLNFLYVHLNRLIKENDLNMIYVIGPGHGGPGIVAQTYLEGSYTERYPAVERSRNG